MLASILPYLVSLVMWLGAILGNIIYYLNGCVIGAWIPTGALWWSGKGDLIMLSHLFLQDQDSRMTNFHWVANKYHIYMYMHWHVYLQGNYSCVKCVIKSPQSEVTLCCQCVAAEMILLLTSKSFQLNLRYLRQRKYRYGKMYWMTFLWPWSKVMAVALINKKICLSAGFSENHLTI